MLLSMAAPEPSAISDRQRVANTKDTAQQVQYLLEFAGPGPKSGPRLTVEVAPQMFWWNHEGHIKSTILARNNSLRIRLSCGTCVWKTLGSSLANTDTAPDPLHTEWNRLRGHPGANRGARCRDSSCRTSNGSSRPERLRCKMLQDADLTWTLAFLIYMVLWVISARHAWSIKGSWNAAGWIGACHSCMVWWCSQPRAHSRRMSDRTWIKLDSKILQNHWGLKLPASTLYFAQGCSKYPKYKKGGNSPNKSISPCQLL